LGKRRDVPTTVWVQKQEAEAILRLLEAMPDRWLKATDFIHEAIREKLHREGKRYSGP